LITKTIQMVFKYLKDSLYYNDLYDLHTIEECLNYYWSIRDRMEKHRKDKEFNKFTKEKFDEEVHKCCSYLINVIKGERYRYKNKAIQEWMDRDRKMQELEDNTQPPVGIYCKECGSQTKMISKTLHNSYSENSKMTFMFECLKCKKRQVRYEDGSEWIYVPPKCPKCNGDMENDIKHKGNTTIFIYECTKCKYIQKDIEDWDKKDKKIEAKFIRDRKLLALYRDEFCLNDKNGPEYLASMDQLMAFSKELKERENKEKNPIYQKAKKLKKLTVVELEALLFKNINKKEYIKFNLGAPEMGQYVIIPFTIQEVNKKKNDRESNLTLRKVIDQALLDTNWRLMNDGISYRLGILSGRLKAYELEEDLIKLVDQIIK